jgi:hypothetical protein
MCHGLGWVCENDPDQGCQCGAHALSLYETDDVKERIHEPDTSGNCEDRVRDVKRRAPLRIL